MFYTYKMFIQKNIFSLDCLRPLKATYTLYMYPVFSNSPPHALFVVSKFSIYDAKFMHKNDNPRQLFFLKSEIILKIAIELSFISIKYMQTAIH